MKQYIISIVGGPSVEQGVLSPSRSGDAFNLALSFRSRVITASGSDFFEAFCQVRQELEPASLVPACYGASLTVYPSSMSRQMSGGTVAYKLRLGEQASEKVHVFQSGPDMTLASVDEQRSFYSQWLASLEA